MMDTQYDFDKKYTMLIVESTYIVYVLPENVGYLNDLLFDQAYVLKQRGSKEKVNWLLLHDKNRTNISVVSVSSPDSYLQGYALLLPSEFPVEREEALIQTGDGKISRLFTYSVSGETFIPELFKDIVIDEKECSDLVSLHKQPLIDASTITDNSPLAYAASHLKQLTLFG